MTLQKLNFSCTIFKLTLLIIINLSVKWIITHIIKHCIKSKLLFCIIYSSGFGVETFYINRLTNRLIFTITVKYKIFQFLEIFC